MLPMFTAAVVAGVAVLGLIAGVAPDHHAEKILAGIGAGVDRQPKARWA